MKTPVTEGFWSGFLTRTRIEHLWAMLPAVLLAIVSFSNPLRLLDFWWHLKLGQVIVETRSLPQVDLFSFTAAGQPFIPGNWLAEVVYYVLYLLGGFPLLRTFNTGLLILALALSLRLAWEWTRRIRLSVASLFVLLIPLWIYSSVRPQVFSFPLLAAYCWILFRPGAAQSRARYLLPVLMLLWVNLHGAFLLGLGLIFIRIAGDVFSRFLRNQVTPGARQWTRWLPPLALAAAVTLLNPQGHRIYSYVLTVLSDPASQRFVSEWQAPEVLSWSGFFCFFGPFFATLLVLLLSSRANTHEILLFLSFSVLGFSALRNGIWLALVAVPLVARHLDLLQPGPLGQTNARDSAGLSTQINRGMAVLMILVVLGLSPWIYPRWKGTPQWDAATPVEVMDFIQGRHLKGNIFHTQIYGDYLIWRLWPEQRSFVDGRVHLFGKFFNQNYLELFSDSCWPSRLEPYDIRYLLLPLTESRNQRLIADALQSPSWKVLFRDQLSILFEHRGEGDP